MNPDKALENLNNYLITAGYAENTRIRVFNEAQTYLAFCRFEIQKSFLIEESGMKYLQACSAMGRNIELPRRALILLGESLRIAGFSPIISKRKVKPPMKRRRIPSVLSEEEVKKILSLFNPENPKENQIRLAVLTLYCTGLRISELLSLKKEQAFLDRFILTGKGRKDREVFLIPELKKELAPYAETLADHSALFHFSASALQKAVKASAVKAGIIKTVTPHTFRHTYASHLLKNGAGISYIAGLLGHSSVSTTQIYTHLEKEHLRKAFDNFHPNA